MDNPSFLTQREKEERGKIEVKGKGEMTTYWINGKAGRTAPTKDEVRITGYHWLINQYLNIFINKCRQ